MLQHGRHRAPRRASRRRAVLLPSVLLAVVGTAFAGLAVLPAAAAYGPPEMVAATAPVELTVPAGANVALMGALTQGWTVANAPKPPPQRVPARASRARSAGLVTTEARKFVRPGVGRLTSEYGRRWGRLHAGIDLASGIGAPISAVTDGTVMTAGTERGYGRSVRLRHADGTVSLYGHLSAISVEEGQQVAAGELLGREGNTGRSTGPHLHFEVRVDDVPVNPLTWLREHGVKI